MECLKPLSIRNPHWLDGSDLRHRWIVVPCGKCPACLINRRNEWALRMRLESKCHINNYFVTLTYDDFNEPWEDYNGFFLPQVKKADLQRFFKRLRTNFSRVHRFTSGFRYVAVSEYCPTSCRPHYHLILFGYEVGLQQAHYDIQKAWPSGFVQVGPLRDGGASYAAKYLFKKQPDMLGLRPNFLLASRRPCIGSSYFTPQLKKFINNSREKLLPQPGGVKVSLPRVFHSKIFTDEDLFEIGQKNIDESMDKILDKIESETHVRGDAYRAVDFLRSNNEAKWLLAQQSINNSLKKQKLK